MKVSLKYRAMFTDTDAKSVHGIIIAVNTCHGPSDFN